MVNGGRPVKRVSLDLDIEQNNFLHMYAVKNQVTKAVVMRCLIWMLQSDPTISARVIDEIFDAPEEEDVIFEDEE